MPNARVTAPERTKEADLIRYRWSRPGQTPIEMAGFFTPERWAEFVKKPHPLYNDVTVTRLS